MTLNQLIRGAQLLGTDMDSHDVCCEHDQIYIFGTAPDELSVEASRELETLGWFWDEETDSWSHYT
jgi:hypothetical protein